MPINSDMSVGSSDRAAKREELIRDLLSGKKGAFARELAEENTEDSSGNPSIPGKKKGSTDNSSSTSNPQKMVDDSASQANEGALQAVNPQVVSKTKDGTVNQANGKTKTSIHATTSEKTTSTGSTGQIAKMVSDMLTSESISVVNSPDDFTKMIETQLGSNATAAAAIASPKLSSSSATGGVNMPFSDMNPEQVKEMSAKISAMMAQSSASTDTVNDAARSVLENGQTNMITITAPEGLSDAAMLARVQQLLLNTMALMNDMSQSSRQAKVATAQTSLKLGMSAADKLMKQSKNIMSGMIAATVIGVAGIAASGASTMKSMKNFSTSMKSRKQMTTLVDHTPDNVGLAAVKTGSGVKKNAPATAAKGDTQLDFSTERSRLQNKADESAGKAQNLSAVSGMSLQAMGTFTNLINQKTEAGNKELESQKVVAESMKQFLDVQVNNDGERAQKQQAAFDGMVRAYADITEGYNRSSRISG